MGCYLSKVGNDWNEWALTRKYQICNKLDVLDTCMNEINANCLKFGQLFLRQYIAHWDNDGEIPPSCFNTILNRTHVSVPRDIVSVPRDIEIDENNNSNNEVKPEFPIFVQLIKELVVIQKRLEEL